MTTIPPKITFLRCSNLTMAKQAVEYFLRHNGHNGNANIGVRNSMWVTSGQWMHVVYWTCSAKNSVTCMLAEEPK